MLTLFAGLNFEMNNNIYRRYCNVCSLLLIHNGRGRGREHERKHGRELGHGHGHGHEKLEYFGRGTL